MKKLTLFTIILFSFLSTNAHAHVKTLYSDKGITTYCVDGMKFAVAGGVSIVQVMAVSYTHLTLPTILLV